MYAAEFRKHKIAIKTYIDQDRLKTGARVRREVKILNSLANSPYIQQLHPMLNPDGAQTICTYFAGQHLFAARVSGTVAEQYLLQICTAMATAQEKKWCHGDMHPGNIVVKEYVPPSSPRFLVFPFIQLTESRGVISVVDWEAALQDGRFIRGLTGLPAFASTSILNASLMAEDYLFSWYDDLESIAYPKVMSVMVHELIE